MVGGGWRVVVGGWVVGGGWWVVGGGVSNVHIEALVENYVTAGEHLSNRQICVVVRDFHGLRDHSTQGTENPRFWSDVSVWTGDSDEGERVERVGASLGGA